MRILDTLFTLFRRRKRFDDMGLVARPSSPEEFAAFLVSEMNRWKAILAKKP